MNEEDNKPFDPAIFGFSTSSGAFKIDTNNINYANYFFKVTLEAELEDVANSKIDYVFYVSIINGCEAITVLPPVAIDNSPFLFDLWVQDSYKFNYAKFDPPNSN